MNQRQVLAPLLMQWWSHSYDHHICIVTLNLIQIFCSINLYWIQLCCSRVWVSPSEILRCSDQNLINRDKTLLIFSYIKYFNLKHHKHLMILVLNDWWLFEILELLVLLLPLEFIIKSHDFLGVFGLVWCLCLGSLPDFW